MRNRFHFKMRFVISILALILATDCSADVKTDLSAINLPDGFRIEIYADQIPGARSMTLGAEGTLFVGTRRDGNVYAVVDEDDDRQADRIFTIATDLNMPNGVAFRDGSLYVAEVDRILRFDEIESRLEDPPAPVVVTDHSLWAGRETLRSRRRSLQHLRS